MRGEVPDTVEVREGPIHLSVDLQHGQKTGLFLDQRENHAVAAGYARGRGLDAFTYHGGFALRLAARCTTVMALDSSAPAVAEIATAARRNGLTNVDAREANVFDELREFDIARERFDTIVLDPPAFAKNKASVERAAAGYKEINLRALRLLAPGRAPDYLQLLLQRRRDAVSRDPGTGGRRRPRDRVRGRKAHPGPRSPGAAERARDALPEVLRAAEAGLTCYIRDTMSQPIDQPLTDADVDHAYPNSRKVHLEGPGGVRVPVREITLSGGEPAVQVYDASGPRHRDLERGAAGAPPGLDSTAAATPTRSSARAAGPRGARRRA